MYVELKRIPTLEKAQSNLMRAMAKVVANKATNSVRKTGMFDAAT